ncbi:HD domain-containing protein [Favolaschia claudopus]|uniref:HD domain-containing protein n=1 Tax=Favolaschia claudopus TaxID=2862362 RepID=A0AAW0DM49_9AGAR
MPTAGMQVPAGGNKNALNKVFEVNGKRPWSYNLFGCFDAFGLCCCACCCPCIVYGKNKQRTPDAEVETFSGPCWTHCALTTCCGLGWVLQYMNRVEVRSRYGVDGNEVKDIFASWCCTPCDLVQVSREIELEEQSFGQQQV